jgi:hypothetical protein
MHFHTISITGSSTDRSVHLPVYVTVGDFSLLELRPHNYRVIGFKTQGCGGAWVYYQY